MIHQTDHGKVRELRLDRPPANAFNPALVEELTHALRGALPDGAEAVVISGAPGMFTGGLDVPELLRLEREGIRAFWKSFYGLLGAVAASEVPTAAAITGHSPAAGAVLAVFCDHRVMAEGAFKFGMNEVQVGLAVPAPLQYGLRRLAGARVADALLVAGALVTPAEALRAGLVDEVVPPGEVVRRACVWAERLIALPRAAMRETRRIARADLVAQFDALGEDGYDRVTDRWFSDETQATLRALVTRLQKT
jgi:enoyl-CoA hydratase/carnithine racemase